MNETDCFMYLMASRGSWRYKWTVSVGVFWGRAFCTMVGCVLAFSLGEIDSGCWSLGYKRPLPRSVFEYLVSRHSLDPGLRVLALWRGGVELH